MPPGSIKTGAVCVYHRFVGNSRHRALPVAASRSRRSPRAFPAGLIPHPLKLKEIEASVKDGAAENRYRRDA